MLTALEILQSTAHVLGTPVSSFQMTGARSIAKDSDLFDSFAEIMGGLLSQPNNSRYYIPADEWQDSWFTSTGVVLPIHELTGKSSKQVAHLDLRLRALSDETTLFVEYGNFVPAVAGSMESGRLIGSQSYLLVSDDVDEISGEDTVQFSMEKLRDACIEIANGITQSLKQL